MQNQDLKWNPNRFRFVEWIVAGVLSVELRRVAVILSLGIGLLLVLPQTARAGNIYLTGHDVLLHIGQLGYDDVILDFLREEGTPGEIPKENYSIAVIGSGVGRWEFEELGDGQTRVSFYCKVRSNSLLMHIGFALGGERGHNMVYQQILAALKTRAESSPS